MVCFRQSYCFRTLSQVSVYLLILLFHLPLILVFYSCMLFSVWSCNLSHLLEIFPFKLFGYGIITIFTKTQQNLRIRNSVNFFLRIYIKLVFLFYRPSLSHHFPSLWKYLGSIYCGTCEAIKPSLVNHVLT